MADHLPLMTSYLVTIETDHHWTCLKMRARDKGTPTKNISCWCFILYEKLRITLGGGIHPPLSYFRTEKSKRRQRDYLD